MPTLDRSFELSKRDLERYLDFYEAQGKAEPGWDDRRMLRMSGSDSANQVAAIGNAAQG